MRIDRTHVPWALFVTVVSIAAGVLYCFEFYPKLLPFSFELPGLIKGAAKERNSFGATPLGLTYGSISLLIFFFASALGVRKKKRLWRIGNVQSWLRAHIWLTVLTVPLVLFHSGFHLGGPMTTTVMVLYGIVMISGFLGIALQQVMPQLMKERLSREVVYEQIPHIQSLILEAALTLRGQLYKASKPQEVSLAQMPVGELAVAADPSEQVLLEFLDDEALPYLGSPGMGTKSRLYNQRTSDDVFRLLQLNVSDAFRSKVDEMKIWCDDCRLMRMQSRMHHWLHGWLIFHVPFSFALLVFTCWHAYITWIYL